MTNSINHSVNEEEIDLRQLVKTLVESKKLIVSTILIFIIASIIYSVSQKPSFKTSIKLEIGYFELENGERKLIESPSAIISNLKILLLKDPDNKFNQEVSIKPLEGKVINLETTSSSAEQNETLLTEMINSVYEHHSKLALSLNKKKQDEISLNLESVLSEIDFIKEKQIDGNQEKKITINLELESVLSEIDFIKEKEISDIEGRLYILSNELPIIDLEISQLEKVIMSDSRNLLLLKENDDLLSARAANSPTLEEIIFSYESKINSLNRKKSSYILEAKTLKNKLESGSLKSGALFNLELRQKALENQLQILENVSPQSGELFDLEKRRRDLENQLKKLTSQTLLKTRPIRDIQTITVKTKTQLIISLGIIFGLFTSILFVFIRNFVKSYKESQS